MPVQLRQVLGEAAVVVGLQRRAAVQEEAAQRLAQKKAVRRRVGGPSVCFLLVVSFPRRKNNKCVTSFSWVVGWLAGDGCWSKNRETPKWLVNGND